MPRQGQPVVFGDDPALRPGHFRCNQYRCAFFWSEKQKVSGVTAPHSKQAQRY
jgi:hypothetical protein